MRALTERAKSQRGLPPKSPSGKRRIARKGKVSTMFKNIFLVLLTVAGPLAFGCDKTDGKKETDKQVAGQICRMFAHSLDVLMISANDSILDVDITERLHSAMVADRTTAKRFVADFVRFMQKASGKRVVTVWVYSEKIKVAEGQVNFGGDVSVNFF